MKMTFLHQWIFTTIILIGAVLSINALNSTFLPIYQTENVVTQKSVTKIVRYQKAKQLVHINFFFNFDFNYFLFLNNSKINNQYTYTSQQELPSPIDFKSLKIITTKNTDNLIELLS